jgi:hypothetical protein
MHRGICSHVAQDDSQEDRLAALRTEQELLGAQKLKLNEELIHLVQSVAIDEDIASGAPQ